MREFLMELYLLYGEREFELSIIHKTPRGEVIKAMLNGYIVQFGRWPLKRLTPKALEFLKNDS